MILSWGPVDALSVTRTRPSKNHHSSSRAQLRSSTAAGTSDPLYCLLGKPLEEGSLSSQSKVLVTVAVLALSLTAVAGCGGGDDDAGTTATTSTTETTTPSGGGGGTTLKVDADPSGALEFTKSSLRAKPGNVTLEMGNPSAVDHAIGVKGNGVDVEGDTVGKGGVSTATTNLKAGSYEFYCPVDGHEQAGMKGTLTVK